MFMLQDFNYFAYQHATEKQKKIADRYMHYVYNAVGKDCTFYQFETQIIEANLKLQKRVLTNRYEV